MSLSTEPAATPSAVAPPAPRRRRLGRKIAIVAGALLALAAVAIAGTVILVNETTEDAQHVSDRFVQAVQQGDGAAAYALAGPAFRSATTEAQLTGLVQDLATLTTTERSLSGKSINVSTGAGKVAVFTYEIEAAGGGRLHFKTQVRKEDGGWQLMNFRSSRSPLDTDVE